MKERIVIPFNQFFTTEAVPVQFRIENPQVVIVEAPTGPLAVGVDHELVINEDGSMFSRASTEEKEQKVSKK